MIIYIKPEFQDGFKQSIDTSMRNLADQISVEMKKLAPFATGALVRSITTRKNDDEWTVLVGVPYGIRRNFENKLHPQTLHYIENGVENVAKGTTSRWWKSEL